MSEKLRPKSRVKFWSIVVLVFLVLDLLASGPYRGMARNKMISHSIYSTLYPIIAPAAFISDLPFVFPFMNAYWNWWDGILKKSKPAESPN